MMAKIIAQEENATPSTPASGKWAWYFKSDGLYTLDDAGAETKIDVPDLIPQAEAEAGTATTERLISAERLKQAIDALWGGTNHVINGAMRVDQRNSGASQTIVANAAKAYTVDRFYAYCTGANATGQRVAGSGQDPYRYQFTGASGVTGIQFGQRIEQRYSYDLNGQTVTLSVDLANSLLTTVTWTAYYANTADSFGTIASPTRTQIATGFWTVSSTLDRYDAQIDIPAAATTGIEVVLSVGSQVSGTWTIGNVKLAQGNTAADFVYGIDENELACRRYCRKTPKMTGIWTTSTALRILGQMDVVMFAYPTAILLTSTPYAEKWNVSAHYGNNSTITSNGSIYDTIDLTINGYTTSNVYGDPAMFLQDQVLLTAEL